MKPTIEFVSPIGGHPEDLQAVLRGPCGITISNRWHTQAGHYLWGNLSIGKRSVVINVLIRHRRQYPDCECIRELWAEHMPGDPWDLDLRDLIDDLDCLASYLEEWIAVLDGEVRPDLGMQSYVARRVLDAVERRDGGSSRFQPIGERDLVRAARRRLAKIRRRVVAFCAQLSQGYEPTSMEIQDMRTLEGRLLNTCLFSLDEESLIELANELDDAEEFENSPWM